MLSTLPSLAAVKLRSLQLMMLACSMAVPLGCGDPEPEPAERRWQEAFDAERVGWLLSVWGDTDADAYAAGGSETDGVLMHFDGSDWQPVELGFQVPLLTWVYGFGADDVTVVGNEGTVLHFDGMKWQQQATPTEQNLWGVWGAAPDELWAVGGRGRVDGEATLLSFDGEQWETAELPDFERSGVNALFKVWGTSRDNVYAVGQRGAVVHYDGSEWTEQLVGASDDLISVWGTDPEHVIAVGGRTSGILSVFDGQAWHTESLAPLRGFNGVWLRRPNLAHIVGEQGTSLAFDLEDSSFQDLSVDTALDLHGIFGVPGGELVAVGGNFLGPVPPYQGIALRRPLEENE